MYLFYVLGGCSHDVHLPYQHLCKNKRHIPKHIRKWTNNYIGEKNHYYAQCVLAQLIAAKRSRLADLPDPEFL